MRDLAMIRRGEEEEEDKDAEGKRKKKRCSHKRRSSFKRNDKSAGTVDEWSVVCMCVRITVSVCVVMGKKSTGQAQFSGP